MTARRITVAYLSTTRWRNGGGTTRELLSWPLGAGEDRFDWRVSLATIDTDGPFSTFPDVDRTITLLDGDGIQLRGPGVAHRLDTLYTPLRFDGATPLECTLLGPRRCTALNVMTRRWCGRSNVDIVTAPTTVTFTHGLLLSLRGDWWVDGDQVSTNTGLWWVGPAREWALQPTSGDDQLVVATWEPT